MKIKNFIKTSFFVVLALPIFGCGKSQIEKCDKITVAGIELVRIPDSAEHSGFYMGKYEVTQKQWQEIMGCNPSLFKGDSSRPVENVSWNDCQEFIKKLNSSSDVKRLGIEFFLPTQEEWEYACSAGGSGQFGLLADGREGTINEMGWCKNNSGDQTHPVGQKLPNMWGLYDMHGNVYEWTASSHNEEGRFLRGGSCYSDASFCETGDWFWLNSDSKSDCLGLRLACRFRTAK